MSIRREVDDLFQDDGNGEIHGCEHWGAAYMNVFDGVDVDDFDPELQDDVSEFISGCKNIANALFQLCSDFQNGRDVALARPYESKEDLLSMGGDAYAYDDEDIDDHTIGFGEPNGWMDADSLFSRAFLDWEGCLYPSEMDFCIGYSDELISRIIQTVSSYGFEKGESGEWDRRNFNYYKEGRKWDEFKQRLLNIGELCSETFEKMLHIEGSE